jgi:hypothetical protein
MESVAVERLFRPANCSKNVHALPRTEQDDAAAVIEEVGFRSGDAVGKAAKVFNRIPVARYIYLPSIGCDHWCPSSFRRGRILRAIFWRLHNTLCGLLRACQISRYRCVCRYVEQLLSSDGRADTRLSSRYDYLFVLLCLRYFCLEVESRRSATRVEEDLVDQLLNSSEKRLARVLLLMANFGKESKPEPVIAK